MENNNISDLINTLYEDLFGEKLMGGTIASCISQIKKAVSELKKMDSILTDIRKHSDSLSKKDLSEIARSAYDTAGKYGLSASDYLSAAQEMYQSGYRNLEAMSELSLLVQASTDFTQNMANDYITASDAIFHFNGSVEKLNALLDGQTQIAAKNTLQMKELADATRIAGSLLSDTAQLEENQISALLGAGIKTSGDSAEQAAQAIKSIVMNLQQIKGKGGFSGEIIDDEQLAKAQACLQSLGIELEAVQNGILTLRSPIDILEELAAAYQSLPVNSPARSGIISDIGGEYGQNVLTGLLSEWNTYEKMLADYDNSAGAAMKKAMQSAEGWEGSLNRLSNTWASTVGNIADSDGITAGINALNSLLGVVNRLTSALGSAGSIGAGLGAYLSAKNLGKQVLVYLPQNHCYCFEYARHA